MAKDIEIKINVPQDAVSRVWDGLCRMFERQLENTAGLPRETNSAEQRQREIEMALAVCEMERAIKELETDPEMDLELKAFKRGQILFGHPINDTKH